jgi:hypothetical protein
MKEEEKEKKISLFEKEAEEYAKQNNPAEYGVRATHFTVLNSFQDGAEFGYNKANEWHYVKDGDLPKENKLYFVAIKDNGLAIAYFNGLHWETRYNLGDFGHCVETVIAWKEIVLPKEIE